MEELVRSAEGGAQHVAVPTSALHRGGAPLFVFFLPQEEDTACGARVCANRWHWHWEEGQSVQEQERPWENLVVLRDKEESLPPMRVKNLCEAAISHKFTTGGKSGEVSLQGAAGLVGRNV